MSDPTRTPTTNPHWRPITEAPRDGTAIMGLQGILAQRTWWGKTSHVPLYGWCYVIDRDDPEDVTLWQPTHWQAV